MNLSVSFEGLGLLLDDGKGLEQNVVNRDGDSSDFLCLI